MGKHSPEIIRRVHPNFHHTHQCSYNISANLSVIILRSGSINGAFLALQLACHEVHSGLVMLKSGLRFIVA